MIIKQIFTQRKPLTNNLDGRRLTESERYGIWAQVLKAHSDSHSVDVKLETGFEAKYVPVASREWFNDQSDKVSGERNLPPIGSAVFIFMPDKRLETGFVLCSGYNPMSAKGEAALSDEGKENERIRILPGNWKRVYDYETGDFTETSPDELIKVTVKPSESVELLAFDTKITATKDESLIIESFDSTITVKSGEVQVKTGGKLVMDAGGKIVAKNAAGSLATLVGELLDDLIGLTTMGPPPKHVVSPDVILKLNVLKTKFQALLEE